MGFCGAFFLAVFVRQAEERLSIRVVGLGLLTVCHVQILKGREVMVEVKIWLAGVDCVSRSPQLLLIFFQFLVLCAYKCLAHCSYWLHALNLFPAFIAMTVLQLFWWSSFLVCYGYEVLRCINVCALDIASTSIYVLVKISSSGGNKKGVLKTPKPLTFHSVLKD